MIVVLILAVSTLLQITAAILALRLIRVTGARSVWLLIAAAIALMSVRRLITLVRVLTGDPMPTADPLAEGIALLISVLMVAGIAGISPIFRQVQRNAEALRRSESQHRAIMEQASDGIFITDAAGRYVAVNQRGCEMTGYSEDELQRMTIHDLADPEDLAVNPSNLTELQSGQPAFSTRRIRRKDGRVITVELSARMLSDGRILGIARDATRRMQAEADQRSHAEQQEVIVQLTSRALKGEDIERLQAMAVECVSFSLEAPLCGMFRAQADGQTLSLAAGVGWEEETDWVLRADPGSLPADVLRRDGPVFVDESLPGGTGELPEILRRSGARSGLFVAIPGREHPLGLLCALARQPRSFRGQDGRFLQAVAHVLASAAERKGVEGALARREARFRSLIEHAHDIIIILDSQGRFLYSSPAVARVLGYTPSDLEGRPVLEFVHPDDHQAVTSALRRGLSRPGRVESVSLRIRHRDGAWRSFEAVGSRMHQDDEAPAMVINSRDVTQRRQAEEALRESEEQLRQSQKMEAVGRLAGGIAHDFNNVLTAILGYGELLLTRMRSADPSYRTVAEIQKAAERAASLTRQLLSFSRRHVHQPRILDLNALASETHSLLERIIGEHIDLQLHLGTGLPALPADPAQMQQVIMNLVLNAADALPEGGSIRVETAVFDPTTASGRTVDLPPRAHLRLSVVDNGCGMDAHTLDRALEPFFTTKKEGRGTGLGLSTVYGIVRQSGGDLRIQSAPGRGTRVDVFLPAATASLAAAVEPTEPEHPRSGSETILLVEDDDAVRELSRTVLESRGYTVLAATSGDEALRLARQAGTSIDLVLTDVVMPGLSGRELAHSLSKLHPSAAVLYMSGYTDGALTGQELADSQALFLAKPFTARELAERVRTLLDRRTVA